MSDILVFAEPDHGHIKKTAFELLSQATKLAKDLGGTVMAMVIGESKDEIQKDLAAYGATKIAFVKNGALVKYNTVGYAAALEKVIQELKPSVVLASASAVGKDFMPRLSAKIKAGLASDVVDLRVEGGKLVAKKPVYSGKVFVDVMFHSNIQMATVRPNSFPLVQKRDGAQAQTIEINLENNTWPNPLIDVVHSVGENKADLTEAEIIVSGGRAMANPDNFKILHEFADVIGATVGASRAAVDSGYAPQDMQVGQTGKVVNPVLYIACGISGAIQHLAGMRTSKVIVAINKDPDAPIFQKADYGIVGNLFEIVPLLTSEAKKLVS